MTKKSEPALKRFALVQRGEIIGLIDLEKKPTGRDLEADVHAVEVRLDEEIAVGGSFDQSGRYLPPTSVRHHGASGKLISCAVVDGETIVNSIVVIEGEEFEPPKGCRIVAGEYAIGGKLSRSGKYTPPPEPPAQ